MRRIVTGHDENGKSIITLDGPPARSIGEEVGGLFELWNTDGESVTSTDNIDRADSDILLCPPKNGTKFRYFQINPLPEGVPKEIMDQIAHENFAQVGAEHTRVDTKRHPAMHKTETIDYIILLKGNVTLLVDNDEVDLEPHDVVVQRGTNHAWVNKGTEPALLIAVLIDSKIN
ncbi:MAG: cupin domain protein [Gammaproteobacteria bacterium]|nr:cupin domain protein [Gammaproteobacteria bacterium]|tara:strand:+ start:309 stop:830 length:522 start_codon:yes stop_codon:yes gene_type:complete